MSTEGFPKGFKIRWHVLISLIMIHLGACVAPFYFTKEAFVLTVVSHVLTGLLGVTVGYHRMLTHKSFETYRLIKWIHILFASFTLQQGPISWVRIHRAHHAHSDTDLDPHPQHLGFWYGHCGWAFLSHVAYGHSEERRTVPKDLIIDPMMIFFEKAHYHIYIFSLILLLAYGGMPYLLWPGCVRTVYTLHVTWCVNSVCHRFGYANYPSEAPSTNNSLVALMSFGDGWHNNHHKYPWSARHGLRWWEIDLSWIWISLLESLGLAWNVKYASWKPESR